VPRIEVSAPPRGLAETAAWLAATVTRSLATLSPEARGRPEGVVVRTHGRERIAKIRFEDYERTLRAR
jgi:hypothetical protein